MVPLRRPPHRDFEVDPFEQELLRAEAKADADWGHWTRSEVQLQEARVYQEQLRRDRSWGTDWWCWEPPISERQT